jgi:hypothetical protein
MAGGALSHGFMRHECQNCICLTLTFSFTPLTQVFQNDCNFHDLPIIKAKGSVLCFIQGEFLLTPVTSQVNSEHQIEQKCSTNHGPIPNRLAIIFNLVFFLTYQSLIHH